MWLWNAASGEPERGRLTGSGNTGGGNNKHGGIEGAGSGGNGDGDGAQRHSPLHLHQTVKAVHIPPAGAVTNGSGDGNGNGCPGGCC